MATSLPLRGLAAAFLLVSASHNGAADPTPARLSQVAITPASEGTPSSFSGIVTGAPPNGTARLQASVDMGVADTWTDIATAPLDNLGSATFTNITDSRPQAAAAKWNFFRVSTSAPPPLPPSTVEFALIPAGWFVMGDQSNPLVGAIDERPAHSVYVSAFYMGRYEVTKELWDEVRAWGLNNGYTDLRNGVVKAANHPVYSITWYDMVKWCNARSQKENLTPCYTVSGSTYRTGSSDPVCNWNASGYRLPTEAEWEKAARGGLTGKNFPWGDTISHIQANYTVLSTNETTNDFSYDVTPRPPATGKYYSHPTYTVGPGSTYSSPVGSFAPNGYGLYDMSGNMWEWCWDWYPSYPSAPQTDPRGPESGTYRTERGGSWGSRAELCRVAERVYSRPTGSLNTISFRLARGQP